MQNNEDLHAAPAPSVSIIIPAYNAADYIGETLESVLAQSFSDFEV
ncbi:MAG: glycosyltransferase, partial [Candidatus Acidiferrales bacterium]